MSVRWPLPSRLPVAARVLLAAALVLVHPGERPGGSEVVRIEGQTSGYEGEPFAFTAAVENPAGEALTFTWDFGDGTPQQVGLERNSVAHRYVDDGEYQLNVQVQGNDGLVGSASIQVTVANADPVIHSMTAGPDALPGEEMRFEAYASDAGDDELFYTWEFGDGAMSSDTQSGATHVYENVGDYQVKLTVEDGDGGIAERIASVRVLPEYAAIVTGALNLQLEGTETGTLPQASGVPVPTAMRLPALPGGACSVNIGFSDPQLGGRLSFNIRGDDFWRNRDIPVVEPEALARGSVPRGMMLTFVYGAGALPGVAAAEEQAEEEEGGGLFGRIRRAARVVTGGPRDPPVYVPEAPDVPQGGTSWSFVAQGGGLQITRITEDRLYARFEANMEGARAGPDPGSSQYPVYANITGSFVWRFGENTEWREAMQGCGTVPFTIAEHSPRREEDNVDFRNSSIDVRLTKPYDRATVAPATVQVGYVDASGTFRTIDGRIVDSADNLSFSFVPDDELIDGIYYRVRITGGESGIRSEAGNTLAGSYEWRFATTPDLVPARRTAAFGRHVPAGGGVQATAIHAALDALEAGPAPIANGGGAASAGAVGIPGSIPLDVECHVFQTSRDPSRLIEGKPALIRVYASWAPDSRVAESEQVEDIYAHVTVRAGWWRREISNHRFVRPDLYEEKGILEALAEHTANVFGWRPDRFDGSPVEATVRVVSPRSDQVHEYGAACGVSYWDQRPIVRARLHLLQIGPWADGVPASARQTVNELIVPGKIFSVQTLPITDLTIGWPTNVKIEEPEEMVSLSTETGVERYYLVDGEEVETHEYITDRLREAGIGAEIDVLDIVFVPPNILRDNLQGQVRLDYVTRIPGLWEYWSDTPRFMLMPVAGGVNGAHIAHELIHWFGGSGHCPREVGKDAFPGCRDGIEGFKLSYPRGTTGWNKSQIEGNAEDLLSPARVASVQDSPYSLLCPGGRPGTPCPVPHDTRLSFTLDFMYDAVFDLVADRIASAGAAADARWTGRTAPVLRGQGSLASRAVLGAAAGVAAALPRSPSIRIVSPRPGEEWSGTRTVRWEGEPGARYILSYRSASREPWQPLGAGLTGSSLAVDSELLEPGPAPELRLMATLDGATTIAAVEFRLANDLAPIGFLPTGEDVEVGTPVVVGFATELDPATIGDATLTLTDRAGERVQAEVRYGAIERILSLVPRQPLRHGAEYTARLDESLRDRWGNGLAADVEWTVRTLDDMRPPHVVRVVPAPGALTVAPEARISITFNENMDPASFGDGAITVTDSGGGEVDGIVRYEGDTRRAVFTPAGGLEQSTTYTVTVETLVRDEAGNRLDAALTSTFTTAGEVLPVGGDDRGQDG